MFFAKLAISEFAQISEFGQSFNESICQKFVPTSEFGKIW